MFCCGVRRNGAKPIVFENYFDNTEHKSRTSCIVQLKSAMLKELGVYDSDNGTHSFKKGLAELLSGMVGELLQYQFTRV